MARNTTAKNAGGGGPARIRLVILEAESPDGDLSQVTLAVQNALRSSDGGSSTRRAITTIAQKGPPANDRPASDDAEDVETHEADDAVAETEDAGQAAPRAAKSRKPPKTPTVLDLDLNSGVSFESFARDKAPTSDHKRYLVIATWFKEHRQVPAITADHVYTCYRAVKWPTSISDFSQPLRDLKARQLLVAGEKKGEYSINHLGIAEVEKLGT